ncbi:MAG: hypothetical protein PHP08_01605 [Candidatus Dojkabacteria bacterium]|nr:hypothetical protein [Candidatus Dojkabacteria bacterium]
MQELKNNQTNTPVQSDDPTQHVQSQPGNVGGSEFEKNTLSPEDLSDRWLRWKCLKCGFVYEGQQPLNVCPKCGNDDPDLFDDAF